MPHIEKMMEGLHDYNDLQKIKEVGQHIRNLFHIAPMPADLAEEIFAAYQELGQRISAKKYSCCRALICNR